MPFWFDYFLLNFVAAAAIAADACALVIIRFRSFSETKVAFQWSAAVGLSHALLPLVGWVLGWFVGIQLLDLSLVVYSIGAGFFVILICWVFWDSVKAQTESEDIEISSILAFWGAVLMVSVDAFLTGPGKTVLSDRYPELLHVVGSFLIVGLLVALFTFIAGLVSRLIHQHWIEGKPASRNSILGILVVLFSRNKRLFLWILLRGIRICAIFTTPLSSFYERRIQARRTSRNSIMSLLSHARGSLHPLVTWIIARYTLPKNLDAFEEMQNTLARILAFSILGELIIFSFFLVWCIVKILENISGLNSPEVTFPHMVGAALAAGGTISIAYYPRIMRAQLKRLQGGGASHQSANTESDSSVRTKHEPFKRN